MLTELVIRTVLDKWIASFTEGVTRTALDTSIASLTEVVTRTALDKSIALFTEVVTRTILDLAAATLTSQHFNSSALLSSLALTVEIHDAVERRFRLPLQDGCLDCCVDSP
ncbi:hypothetical protein [Lactiplantibacillus pentosus]|uniref:hypothetical protein n=1 Tax=Lactiplantibacillus pentosus TaxID=1589 RepID=UPI000D018B45|nr:hypothetical protein [Lactiplantibacillus pentosus]MBU7460734.1 hypothetical protein [Lactiplantibacillus pentosus]MBU7478592.1 hypothetical protein [Lactiplantibacillus pentosus]MBU7499761.1 hypothetical protein [Lactiplantibacillus pentosus]MBU7512723.1 hypothetical protein [Lactiplantibacillus pentosus]MBU7515925.1 hypothetical protein [Lactiplantibacillus pentosus]